ncbi:MAG TPA: PaaI family thioesterase [Methanoculleus sp.]|nr:PaaI family thioesterase [Methanoculleus sp.]
MNGSASIPEDYTEAVRRSDSCEFARMLGMVVTGIEDGRVRVTMPIKGTRNAHGTTHGGAIFAIADHAFGIAANMEGIDQIAISAHIRYFSVPAGDSLEAVARRVSEGEMTSVYAVDVYSADLLVASFEGVGFRTGFPGKAVKPATR